MISREIWKLGKLISLKIQSAGMWRVSVTVTVIKDVQDKYDSTQ